MKEYKDRWNKPIINEPFTFGEHKARMIEKKQKQVRDVQSEHLKQTQEILADLAKGIK